MNPRRISGKLFQKHGLWDRAATLSAADILNVRDAALDEFAVFFVDGHLPHLFSARFRPRKELVGKRLIRTEDADVYVGQRYDDGSGERRSVDQVRAAEPFGVLDAISQNEPAFCVSVQHFDGLTSHGD